jgi:hypothetical protein
MPPPGFIAPSKLEEAASSFLSQYHEVGTIPVPIEEIVEFGFGFDIIPFPNLKRDFDIEGFLACGANAIYVNDIQYQHSSEYRFRFTLAHEVSHHVLHREVYEEAGVTSLEGYLKFQDELDSILRDKYEWQAYSLAGRILVPTKALVNECRDELDKIRTKLPKGGDAQMVCRDVLAPRVADAFNVSLPVVEKRLQDDALCPLIMEENGSD